MTILPRIAVAAALVAGFGSAAQAQARQVEQVAPGYLVVTEGRSVAVDRQVPPYVAGPVPPSFSHTVMGLATPY